MKPAILTVPAEMAPLVQRIVELLQDGSPQGAAIRDIVDGTLAPIPALDPSGQEGEPRRAPFPARREGEAPPWAELRQRQAAADLLVHGPSVSVQARRMGDKAGLRVLAQIDTGSSVTAISPKLARGLGLVPIDTGRFVDEADKGRSAVPVYRLQLLLPGLDIDTDVVGLASLGRPHDVLIGRDLLAKCRLVIDFPAGLTELHFATPQSDEP